MNRLLIAKQAGDVSPKLEDAGMLKYHVDGTTDDDLLKRDFLTVWPTPASVKLLVDPFLEGVTVSACSSGSSGLWNTSILDHYFTVCEQLC